MSRLGILAIGVTLATAVFVTPVRHSAAQGGAKAAWLDRFDEKPADLVSSGKNPYFILEPGYEMELAGKEEGKALRLVVAVLPETKQVDGVETRMVEERETLGGQPVEVSRNYFAVSKRTHNLYYFGEDVDEYKGGKVAGHGGSWLAGKNGARYGLMLPGEPALHMRHYQEIAPKVAMDRAEVVSLSDAMQTPAGRFEKVLKVEETTPLEPDLKEYKYYAPGVGLIKDGNAVLTRYGRK